ncbi:hypothetical protein Tco_1002831 [Tanacetum coccineum]|uniref:Tf2-1-like SH3-like domain-containing protein n=1 Tax=Tanacetum coccineum TaxID=301880 RepID=A0ABQ5F8V1_9ASTR
MTTRRLISYQGPYGYPFSPGHGYSQSNLLACYAIVPSTKQAMDTRSKEWNSGDDQLRLRWMIYLVVLVDAAESVRDAIGFEYCLVSLSGWANIRCAPFEALYGRNLGWPVLWAEIGESSLTGLEIGLVAYRLRLPEELNSMHDTFHVSNLKKCLANASVHVPLDEIKVDKTLCFVEEPVEIMVREIKKLKHRKIALVKVRWNSKRGPEFTWEHEDQED